ncbi:DUF2946 family protein [Pseudoxanthomonas sp. F37]|jgi:hypothetical protein|uniref:DUF2946 family protein n=1 Tax=Pseudoxanthomonas TaxID=83618 RepID=UPI001FD10B47|nr:MULTISPECIES: DUF2946 family protein [Pseudoxanthomonas]UOV05876.1 DUF2946 family protein [Pseudoxanthomonas mexicana]UOV07467.1 DUF2946 family protein [Pseudoxanthomonas sp. F37]
MRSHAFLRPMLQLALLAALLMAFAPSITRWMASEGPQVLAGWTELCTTEGIQWVDTRAESPVGKSPSPDGMPMGADCAYCTLAAALPLLLLALALLFPRPAADVIASVVTLPRARRLRLRGLGGQGPPVLL